MSIYIKNDIIYKVRNDLKIYQSEKLESIFIEIINSNSRNIIVGCVYCHLPMEINEFHRLFLNTLRKNLLLEKNKEIVLLCDLNIDLLKYEKDHNAVDFLDQMYSTSLVRHITSPTWINSCSRTLIEIFSTDISENPISENILTSISDHLVQFLFLPIDQFKTNDNKNICQRNFKSFNQQISHEDIQNLNSGLNKLPTRWRMCTQSAYKWVFMCMKLRAHGSIKTPLKLVSTISYQSCISHQMIALQKLWEMFFIFMVKACGQLLSFNIFW